MQHSQKRIWNVLSSVFYYDTYSCTKLKMTRGSVYLLSLRKNKPYIFYLIFRKLPILWKLSRFLWQRKWILPPACSPLHADWAHFLTRPPVPKLMQKESTHVTLSHSHKSQKSYFSYYTWETHRPQRYIK